jgi:predicted Zn-dependent protease with MMP-like domain
MGRDLFEQFVAEALDTLPDLFQQKMENVQVVVEDWPDSETMRRAGVRHRSQLLGFYHGVPRTKRTHNWEEVLRMVHHVLRHEVAHHFGIDDERLREIGAY